MIFVFIVPYISLVREASRAHAVLSHVVYGVVGVGQEIVRAF